MNEIGVVNLAIDHKLPFDPCGTCQETGSFILMDQSSKRTMGAGIVVHALRRGSNLRHQDFDITRLERGRFLGHPSSILRLTGLPGAGKSTLANAASSALHARGRLTMVLDGDNLRMDLNRDLRFTEADRIENGEGNDPKGFYRKARQNLIPTSPGFTRPMSRRRDPIFGSIRAFFPLKKQSRASSMLYWKMKCKTANHAGRHALGGSFGLV